MFVHCTPHCIDLTDTDLTARVFLVLRALSLFYFIIIIVGIMHLLPFHGEIKIIIYCTCNCSLDS